MIDVVDANVVYPSTSFAYRMAKLVSKLYTSEKGFYDTSSVLKNLSLYRALLKKRKAQNVVHYLNGERDIRHIGILKKLFPNTRFVATFHKTPSILKRQLPDTSSIQKLDGIIVVGKSQLTYFKTLMPSKKICYIPHGVDCNFFKPNFETHKKGILFIGVHLRCWDTLNKITKALKERNEKIHVTLVIKPEYNDNVEIQPNITIINKVDDNALLHLYQNTQLLLLPLKDVTACNSILEALSTGLPIITTDLESNRAYLSDSENILLQNDNIELFIDHILKVINNKSVANDMGISSRKKALDYDWALISKSIADFYKEICITNEV